MHFQTYALKVLTKGYFSSDTISTLDKNYIESPDEFFIALRKMRKIIDYKWLQRSVMLLNICQERHAISKSSKTINFLTIMHKY